MQSTYIIPEANYATLEAKLIKLNRKAFRLGCPAITWVTGEVQEYAQFVAGASDEWNGEEFGWELPQASPAPGKRYTGVLRPMLPVTITGESPRYNGWEFIATLETLHGDNGEAENIVLAAPGKECPVEYRQSFGVCDHCGHNRQRRQTFVLHHESGEFKVVGRQCIKDFLGGNDPHKAANIAQWWFDVDQSCRESEGFEGGGSGDFDYATLDVFLPWVVSVIRVCGWTSGKSARDFGYRSTGGTAWLLQGGYKLSHTDRQLKAECQPTEADVAKAEAYRSELLAMPEEEIDNDYIRNLHAIARLNIVKSKLIGLAASIPVAMDIRAQRAIERKARPVSNHVGTVGKREEFTIRVLRSVPIESEYGSSYLYIMEDEAGNRLTWFSSTGNLEASEDFIKVRATVKGHDDYKGQKQTKLTRVAEVKAKAPRAKKSKKVDPVAPVEKQW